LLVQVVSEVLIRVPLNFIAEVELVCNSDFEVSVEQLLVHLPLVDSFKDFPVLGLHVLKIRHSIEIISHLLAFDSSQSDGLQVLLLQLEIGAHNL